MISLHFHSQCPGKDKKEAKKEAEPNKDGDKVRGAGNKRPGRGSKAEGNEGFPGGGLFQFSKQAGPDGKEFKFQFRMDGNGFPVLVAMLVALGAGGYAVYNNYSYKEITWQEFYNSYLSKNMVSVNAYAVCLSLANFAGAAKLGHGNS